ncbi:Ubiquitin carboxyl-terminal hydrolase 19 [Morus notabilis]|uniref:Ubiquitin carboxyl-terminal hydrolase 19 n=1 Tax=Morus notabilis TaxID=981085 RepID=W9R7A1_9ROSA|nr:Ubiquitin carboxyl-terminal hydrolase 19 [Morus notabilis]
MHVAGVTLDLNWFLQFILTVFIIAVGVLHLVKNTASKYFEVDANFEGGGGGAHSDRTPMPGVLVDDCACVVCGNSGPKQCSRCKAVRYCSQKCQQKHWKSGHQNDCKLVVQSSGSVIAGQNALRNSQFKASGCGGKTFSGVALVPAPGIFKPINIKQPKDILFPYDEFVKLFNWDKPGFPPCGLLNCGNSCFANVVLQCLASTRPLVAYLLEKGIRSDWCFLCEFQTHLERANQSSQPFSPTNIISRLPNIGGNLGYGRQEDAHEFMRFAIDTMQSVCLDEFGGEKAVPPSLQETTIIQHIFGGHLQSQVICTECNNISNQYENMMDLTVEIHGEAASLEECLDQFTVKEWLHGDNMYKCDGCNDYVKAWKRLTVKRAPNILTVALKRFQSGRFGKLNKRVTFPETLDLSPYMSDDGDGTDVYTLYAVVVHVDMLNASFFGHYICYTKGLCGNWYKLDDCKVTKVELEEVLSQGAYMLLYSRDKARSSCLRAQEPSKDEQKMANGEVELSPNEQIECSLSGESVSTDGSLCLETDLKELPTCINSEAVREHDKDDDVAVIDSISSVAKEASDGERELCFEMNPGASGQEQGGININSCRSSPSISNGPEGPFPIAGKATTLREEDLVNMDVTTHPSCEVFMDNISPCFEKDLSVSDREATQEVAEDTRNVGCESRSFNAEDVKIYSNGYAFEDESALQVENDHKPDSDLHYLKRGTNFQEGNGVKSVEIMEDGS